LSARSAPVGGSSGGGSLTPFDKGYTRNEGTCGQSNVDFVYAFGPFGLDPRRRRLTRDGAELTVTPTVLDVLICLVRNAGRVVTKDELLDAVWPGRIVEEANVKQAVFTLRKALGPDGGGIVFG